MAHLEDIGSNWEQVGDTEVSRLEVPGGWLYRRFASSRKMTFVPDPYYYSPRLIVKGEIKRVGFSEDDQ